MDNYFEKNALSWGEGGAEWLKRLPRLLMDYEDKWSFKAQPPFELNYTYVASVMKQLHKPLPENHNIITVTE